MELFKDVKVIENAEERLLLSLRPEEMLELFSDVGEMKDARERLLFFFRPGYW